jgi:hypothetical protein
MTIATTTRKDGPYLTDGNATEFAFTFDIVSDDELIVYKLDTAAGTEEVLVLDSDYEVIGSDVVTLDTLPVGYEITIFGAVEQTQETELQNQGGWHPEVIEAALDKLTKMVIELQNQVDRCLKISKLDEDAETELDVFDGEASVVVRDADGDFRLDPHYEPVWDSFSVTAPSGGYPSAYDPNTATLGNTMDMVASILNTLKGE